ncbi:hypothetical protein [uncultured Methanospirillum sp.]|uniref:hypothetical protein n=1 Tax=uncultured Methanospirillum sp. TaxID=262503 RepID=UPI0029C8CEBC|nr:hypothetical protein [uncultured Methanospirillum sp.]
MGWGVASPSPNEVGRGPGGSSEDKYAHSCTKSLEILGFSRLQVNIYSIGAIGEVWAEKITLLSQLNYIKIMMS